MNVDGEELWRAVARGERAGLSARDAASELLAELDALRAECDRLRTALANAEQRIRILERDHSQLLNAVDHD